MQVNGTQACICTGHFKHHYDGSFTSYIVASLLRYDPIGESEPDLGCSFNSFYLPFY